MVLVGSWLSLIEGSMSRAKWLVGWFFGLSGNERVKEAGDQRSYSWAKKMSQKSNIISSFKKNELN